MIQVGDIVIGRTGAYFNQEGVVIDITGPSDRAKYSVKWADNVVKKYNKCNISTQAEMAWIKRLSLQPARLVPAGSKRKRSTPPRTPVLTVPAPEPPVVVQLQPVE